MLILNERGSYKQKQVFFEDWNEEETRFFPIYICTLSKDYHMTEEIRKTINKIIN